MEKRKSRSYEKKMRGVGGGKTHEKKGKGYSLRVNRISVKNCWEKGEKEPLKRGKRENAGDKGGTS